jgi:hypothetical protein
MSQLRRVANAKGAAPDDLADRAIRQFLRDEARRMMQQESDAFRRMHTDLLARYPNEYVAIHQGQLVDHDADQLALLARIEDRYPDIPVLIRQVLPEPDEKFTFRSPRLDDER